MKRYFALLLSLLLVLGTVAVPAAVAAEEPLEKRTVFDFSDEQLIEDYNMTAATYEDEGSQVAVGKLTVASGTAAESAAYWLAQHDMQVDFGNYRKINFRIYAEENVVGSTFLIRMHKSEVWGAGRMDYSHTVMQAGWQTVTVEFSSQIVPQAYNRYAVGPEEISGIQFFLNNAQEAAAVSIAEVYLSEPFGSEGAGLSPMPEGRIVADLTTNRGVGLAYNDAVTVDTSSSYVGTQSAKWIPANPGGNVYYIRFDTGIVPANYGYLNFLMRSTGEHSGYRLRIEMLPWKASEPLLNGGQNNGRGGVLLRKDWWDNLTDNGWSIVSIPVSSLTSVENNGASATDFKKYAFGAMTLTSNIGTDSNGKVGYNFGLIWFSKEIPAAPKMTGVSPANGYTDMEAAGAAATFTFSSAIKSVDETKLATALKKTQGGSDAVGCGYEINGKTVTFTAQTQLDYATEYTLTIPAGTVTDALNMVNENAITYQFTTQPSGLNAAVPTLTDANGTQLTAVPADGTIRAASLVRSRGLADEKMATLVLAAYDANNCMVAFDAAEAVIQPNGDEKLVAEIPAAPEIAIIKAFVIDNFFSLSPLQSNFTQLPALQAGSSQSGTQAAALTLTGAEVKDNQLFIVGKVDGALPRMTVIAVSKETAGTPMFLSPIMAEGDGAFSVETLLPEDAENGEYQVMAAARQIDGTQKRTFLYVDAQSQEQLLAGVNAAADLKAITELLKTNRAFLGLPEDGARFAHIAQTVFEQKPYETYADVSSILTRSGELLDQWNASTWADYSGLLAANPMILNGHADENYYNSLSATEKAKLNQTISKAAPFESFVQLRATFALAVSEHRKSAGNNNSGNHTGGGGGGSSGGKKGGSAVNLVSMPSEMLPAIPGDVVTPPELDQTEERFADLTAAEWARESVERLYVAGAIAAAEQFRPNDSVTREEFVKLAAETLGLEKTTAAADFADVDGTAWYAPYIAAMQSMGIVTGYEDGRFGIGEQITRQDMAVMLSRILETMDVKLPVGDMVPFADDSEISSYARDAVYRMREAGVLNGMEDGSFAPAQNASRAQAAKLLCSLLDVLKQ